MNCILFSNLRTVDPTVFFKDNSPIRFISCVTVDFTNYMRLYVCKDHRDTQTFLAREASVCSNLSRTL